MGSPTARSLQGVHLQAKTPLFGKKTEATLSIFIIGLNSLEQRC